jgi:hypothetical protein
LCRGGSDGSPQQACIVLLDGDRLAQPTPSQEERFRVSSANSMESPVVGFYVGSVVKGDTVRHLGGVVHGIVVFAGLGW